MPSRFESTIVSCGPSRTTGNPAVQALGFRGGIVQRIHILIPSGHANLTGIALGYGGNPTIPFGNQAYYSGDDREIVLDYIDNNPGVSYAAFMCNNDGITHVWEVDMEYNEIGVTNAPSTITPVTSAAILSAGSAVLQAS